MSKDIDFYPIKLRSIDSNSSLFYVLSLARVIIQLIKKEESSRTENILLSFNYRYKIMNNTEYNIVIKQSKTEHFVVLQHMGSMAYHFADECKEYSI